jgi:inosine-uridine nucleoside N-ribohydrolase
MDVDTGIDDAIAIMVALQSPKIEVVGITTVSGNVTSRTAGLNTLAILNAMDKRDIEQIPVVQGASRPLSKGMRAVHAEDIHGKKGLGGIKLPYDKSLLLRKIKISQFISETLATCRGYEVSLIATGPLTNVATAIIDDPSIIDSLSEICIMGGAYGLASKGVYGNITQYAEFNFYCDPKAAQIVMDSGARIKVVGLDVTDKYLMVDDKFILQLSDCKHTTKKGKIDGDEQNNNNTTHNNAATIAKSLLRYPLTNFGKFDLPDVFAVAMCERPDLFKFKRVRIDVVQNGERWGHSTLIEEEDVSKGINDKSKTLLAVKVTDKKAFRNYVFSCLC